VRNFFSYESPDSEDGGTEYSSSPLTWLAGIIYLGIEEHENFRHRKYVEDRLMELSNDVPVIKNDERIKSFTAKLRFIDDRFQLILRSERYRRLAASTWILPTQNLSLVGQVET
jgi:hypothetical protein